MPNFIIKTTDQLIKIRENPRLESVKNIINKINFDDITEDMVQNARMDVLEIKDDIHDYVKILQWISESIGLIPIFGSYLKKAFTDIGENLIQKKLEKGHEWKFFFSDLRKLYQKSEILV